MYLAFRIGFFGSIRDVVRAWRLLGMDGWDIVRAELPCEMVEYRACHPQIRTERQARVRLAILGLPCSRFAFVADGPVPA